MAVGARAGVLAACPAHTSVDDLSVVSTPSSARKEKIALCTKEIVYLCVVGVRSNIIMRRMLWREIRHRSLGGYIHTDAARKSKKAATPNQTLHALVNL